MNSENATNAAPVDGIVVRLRQRVVERWDWFVYRLAYHSLRRMCERNGGFAYLFELWIREWRKNHPISLELENATERFFESLRDHAA